MKYLLAFILAFLPLSPAMAASGAHYYAPPGQFNTVMQIMEMGLANVFGLFGNATGSFLYDEEGKSMSGLRLAIDTTSLVASNPQGQHDLAGLIDTTQFAEIRFTALDGVTFADDKASIKGTLTLHGVSKAATLDATINHIGKIAHAGNGQTDALGLSLHGSVKRADFGMTDDPEQPSPFGDTITLQLEMQAIKQ